MWKRSTTNEEIQKIRRMGIPLEAMRKPHSMRKKGARQY